MLCCGLGIGRVRVGLSCIAAHVGRWPGVKVCVMVLMSTQRPDKAQDRQGRTALKEAPGTDGESKVTWNHVGQRGPKPGLEFKFWAPVGLTAVLGLLQMHNL